MTKVFGEVEWITIFFFIGLFMVIAGVEHTGALRLLADKLVEVTGGDLRIPSWVRRGVGIRRVVRDRR